MTKKRFTLRSVGNLDYGIADNGDSIGSLANICELLNDLHEENKALKQTIKKMGELGGFNKHMIKTICGDLE